MARSGRHFSVVKAKVDELRNLRTILHVPARDKLEHANLTLEDWVLAEKDLAQTRMAEGIEV